MKCLLVMICLFSVTQLLAKTETRKPAQVEEISSIEWKCHYSVRSSQGDLKLRDVKSQTMSGATFKFVPLNEEVDVFVRNHIDKKICVKGTFDYNEPAFVYAAKAIEE